jgi:hypothetical protein
MEVGKAVGGKARGREGKRRKKETETGMTNLWGEMEMGTGNRERGDGLAERGTTQLEIGRGILSKKEQKDGREEREGRGGVLKKTERKYTVQ